MTDQINTDQESTFRFNLYTLPFQIQEGETLQAAWKRVAGANAIDADRAVTFKQAGAPVEGSALAKPGLTYSVTVSLSKNG